MVHYKWQMERSRGKRITRRDDYDIALVRLDYPAIDEDNGIFCFFSRNLLVLGNVLLYLPVSVSLRKTAL